MRIRTLLMLVFFVLVGAFVAMNWGELSRQTTLNMGFTQTQGPLGLVMLGLLLLATLVFGAYALAIQTTSLLETREHTKELKTQRDLASNAETSRYTDLRTMIERIETDSKDRAAESRQFMQEQMAAMQKEVRATVEASGNTLAAYLGELEDRLERGDNRTNNTQA
ncbi:MAG: hypothetical protein Q4G39_06210 [Brachymonas sp.]|nr:hypothetical protein [Brachymonas sp.]